MSQEKSWTYAEITLATERNIVRLMQAAAEKEDPTEARTLLSWAWGVFLGWTALTNGWQVDGDSARLEALIGVTSKPTR
jgi:hypothetical protein